MRLAPSTGRSSAANRMMIARPHPRRASGIGGGAPSARACEAKGVRAIAVQADVQNDSDCQRLVAESIASFGGIDVLINWAMSRLMGRAGVSVKNRANSPVVIFALRRGVTSSGE